jgi:hypothetical protein
MRTTSRKAKAIPNNFRAKTDKRESREGRGA